MPVTDLARAIEERGFDSIWVPEHSHIPTIGNTPYPGRGPVTRDFARTLDPFVALTAAATVTTTLKLGTGICLLIQRDTIHTAKTVATLDHVSGGRVLFGVGGGWNKPEMENHGTVYATRFQRLEEQLQALKSDLDGGRSRVSRRARRLSIRCGVWPKPVSRPHPPIFIGGETDHTLRRIVKYADGWLPRVRDPDTGARRHRPAARVCARGGPRPRQHRDQRVRPRGETGRDRTVPRRRRRVARSSRSRRDRSTTCCGGSTVMRNSLPRRKKTTSLLLPVRE